MSDKKLVNDDFDAQLALIEKSISFGRRDFPLYEKYLQLGLGELEPDSVSPSVLRWEQMIAWTYRRSMVAFDSGHRNPIGRFQQTMLGRYRRRIEKGLLRPLEYSFDKSGESDNG
ncbi:hypothetical protein [Caballeronia sp. M23-90]